MKGYLLLILTIVFESTSVIFMKLSAGFHNKLQTAVAVIAYILGFLFLTLALKYIPVGIANAVWAGASTVVVALLGVFLFKEQLNAWQVFFLLLIVIGITGLNLKS